MRRRASQRIGFGGRGFRRAAVVGLAGCVSLFITGCFLFPNTAPVVFLNVTSTEGVAPLSVQFDATGSYDPDGSIRTYRWQFGDGESGTGMRVEHTYAGAGTYQATLTVIDQRRGRATASVTITVRESNTLPVASFAISPSPAFPRQTVRFDAGASYDPDGQIVSYTWDFGDGSTGTGKLASYRYDVQGTYAVMLTVHDNDAGVRSTTIELTVTVETSGSASVARHYEWMYGDQAQACDLEIPLSLYNYYRTQPRIVWTGRDYDEYVLDPLDDTLLTGITQEILSATTGDYHAALENALFFVQHCIRYVYDPQWFEYPRYPVETLVDGIGDCEDTAILYTSLVRTLGHGALMVIVDADRDGTIDHMVAWVPVKQSFIDQHPDRSFWEYQGKTYAFAETAVEGGYLPLGVDPWGLTEANIDTIYNVSSVDRAPTTVRRLVGSGGISN